MVVDVFERILKTIPDMVLIIAPRHIVRTPQIEFLLRNRRIEYQLWSEIREGRKRRIAPVLILNAFGELFGLYRIGSINFCGASLVPLGGQNPLEAAVWGKMVFYGPHMDDFLDAKALLENEGAGIEVANVEAFAEKALWLLSHPDEGSHYGMKAREALMRSKGAAERHASVVLRLLESKTNLHKPL